MPIARELDLYHVSRLHELSFGFSSLFNCGRRTDAEAGCLSDIGTCECQQWLTALIYLCYRLFGLLAQRFPESCLLTIDDLLFLCRSVLCLRHCLTLGSEPCAEVLIVGHLSSS